MLCATAAEGALWRDPLAGQAQLELVTQLAPEELASLTAVRKATLVRQQQLREQEKLLAISARVKTLAVEELALVRRRAL